MHDTKHKEQQSTVSTYLWFGSIFSYRLVSNLLYPFLNCIGDMGNNCKRDKHEIDLSDTDVIISLETMKNFIMDSPYVLITMRGTAFRV